MMKAAHEISQTTKSKLYTSGKHHENLNVWVKGDLEHQNEPLWLDGPQKEFSKSCQNTGKSLEHFSSINSAFLSPRCKNF